MWLNVGLTMRGGGDSWIPGSYDPELGLVYWPTAQAKPWVPANRGLTTNDVVLYTNSTLALNPDNGELVWYVQHVPREALDLDEAFEKVLVEVEGRKALCTIRKHSILMEAEPRDRRVPGTPGNGHSERLRPDRSGERRHHLPAGHRRRGDRGLGIGLSEHRRRAQLARYGLQSWRQPVGNPAQPELSRDPRP